MPRVTKERTKYHAAKAVTGTPDTGNIVSAPVPLAISTEKDSPQVKSKRAKRADRRQKWIEQIGVAQTKQKQEKRAQGRQTSKSALIRGMTDMKSSLKEVQAELIAQHLLSLDNKRVVPLANVKGGLPKSRKARDKAAVCEEKRFGQILAHPAFKANPLATIRQHLANTLQKADSC
ncbi:hypothetical protein GGI20_004088 [Coemansia sp. BCRC 34301]|nr:hypothetical protein GGI20_004088 [Coemansia sp. BCRC 34301]